MLHYPHGAVSVCANQRRPVLRLPARVADRPLGRLGYAQDKHAIDEKITEFTNNQAQLEPLYGSQDQQECARVSCCHVVNTAICLLQV